MRTILSRIHDLFSIPAGIPPVLVWGMASFHAATLVFIVVFYLQLSGGLRGFFSDGQDAGTVIGLIAFVVLWLSSYAGTARGLEKAGAGRFETERMITLISTGSFGGFVSGVTFLLTGAVVVLGAGLVQAIVVGPVKDLPPLLALTVIGVGFGSFFATVIGGLLGLVAGVLDTLLLKTAIAVVGPLPQTPAADAETPAT